MPQLRTFQAWPAYVVTPREAFEALGFMPYHYQARVLISAMSKAAAARKLSEVFASHYTARVIEETGGNDMQALQDAGRLLTPDELYVMDNNHRHGAVVQGTGPMAFEKVGELVRTAPGRGAFGPYTVTFVPEEG